MSGRHALRVALVTLLVVAALLPVPSAQAAPLIVDFEDLSHAKTGRSFTSLTSHRGIGFPDGVTAIDYSRPGYAVAGFSTHSGTVGIEECFGQEFSCPDPIDMAFSSGQFRVKAWVGYTRELTFFRTVKLEAFDGNGRMVGSDDAFLRSPKTGGPIPVNTPLEVAVDTNRIRSARIRFVDSSNRTTDSYNLVADDIEIERGTPAFAITPNPVDYGDVTLGQTKTATVTVTNTGQVRGSIRSAVVTGGNSGDFTIIEDGCSDSAVAVGGTCTLSVRFDPKASGARSSTLAVAHNGTASPATAPLRGNGSTVTVSTSPTTAAPGDSSTPPPTTSVPPPTPGATLVLDRDVGPPGSVIVARGTGFQPGPITLAWAPGLGATEAVAGNDGTFEATVLVLSRSQILGPRLLVATGPVTSANAPFLVVPGSMRPGGSSADIVHRR